MEIRPIHGTIVDARLRAELPPELYWVLHLRVVQGYTVCEAARLLRVPPNTVRLRQHRALQALRRNMSQGEERRRTRV
jgi:DNA-directed RNA polymerase specialized sigma24 family protein